MDEISIVPTLNDSSATFAILDADDMALTDSNTTEDDFQASLDVGANTIKVKVTAQDTTITRTYEVTVARAAPAILSFASDDIAVDESDGTAELTVVLDPPLPVGSSEVVTVDYATGDDTERPSRAIADVDYTATSGTLTFAAEETGKTISIPLTDDTLHEGGAEIVFDESFGVFLTNPVGAVLFDDPHDDLPEGFARVGIADDDPPPTATMTLTNDPVTEGGIIEFTLTLDQVSGLGITYGRRLQSAGTATYEDGEDDDFRLPESGQLRVPAGRADGDL